MLKVMCLNNGVYIFGLHISMVFECFLLAVDGYRRDGIFCVTCSFLKVAARECMVVLLTHRFYKRYLKLSTLNKSFLDGKI